MTLQVGLVGTVGIVLASDLCTTGIENGVRHTSQMSKLVLSATHVFAFAGDEIAELVAHQLSEALEADPNAAPADLMQPIFNSLNRKPKAGSIIGVAQGHLWHLEFGTEIIFRRGGAVSDKAISGDGANAAVLFSERYYSDLRDNMDGLKKLAAHVICMGGKLNPAGVQGLEMLIWDRRTSQIRLGPYHLVRHEFFVSNALLLRPLRFVIEQTSPAATIMDGWTGLGVFRPHTYFYWFLHGEILAMMTDEQRDQLLASLQSGEIAPRYIVLDQELASLSARFLWFVTRNYQPVPSEPILWERKPMQPPP